MCDVRCHAEGSGRGFTLIELLVVIAIMSLLMAILVPSLSQAREQGKRAYCLANLHSIAAAAVSYAGEDNKELIIPIHQMMVTPMPASDFWLWRTANWFSFGGRSAPQPFMTDNGPRSLDDNSPWAARTRPLNRYIYQDIQEADAHALKLFQCPSDRGYPEHPDIDDSPIENSNRLCYDTLGNSYRASLYCFLSPRGGPYDGAFAIGPWGHRLTTIPNSSQVAVFGEPLFFNMIGMDNGVANPDPVIATGWHRRLMVENIAFCDGSARSTRAAGHGTVSEYVARTQMGVGNNWDLISRGPEWRFDLWPTPGARIWAADPEDQRWNAPFTGWGGGRDGLWPFLGAQDNLQPE
jgi:prepilin-type N-terminal cleavage/methylation domain-containing protein